MVELDILVADALCSSPSAIAFRRKLSPGEMVCWQSLYERLRGIHLTSELDAVSWHLMAYNQFSVKYLYA